MRTESLEFTALRILDADRLDPITVLLRDLPTPSRHSGQIIVECYGHAWSCYFGSIGAVSLVEFLSTDPDYLASKLARGTEKKAEQAYLLRIAKAVTAACAELAAAQASAKAELATPA